MSDLSKLHPLSEHAAIPETVRKALEEIYAIRSRMAIIIRNNNRRLLTYEGDIRLGSTYTAEVVEAIQQIDRLLPFIEKGAGEPLAFILVFIRKKIFPLIPIRFIVHTYITTFGKILQRRKQDSSISQDDIKVFENEILLYEEIGRSSSGQRK